MEQAGIRTPHFLVSLSFTVYFTAGRNYKPSNHGKNSLLAQNHGKLNLEICPVENEGNFRALLRFRANFGDEALKKHLEIGSKNALYLSPKTENEIILTINDIMLKKLVEMVNSAKCFTVLADETTDISTQEQASIGVRYLYNNDIKEDFLQFVPVSDLTGKTVSDLTGKNLATVILKSLREFGIDTKYLRGQGYDGASAMSGKFNGAQAYHEHIDLLNAMNMVTNLKRTIEKIRTNAEEEFATIFNASETMAELLSTSIKAPRRTGRQTLRCNLETDNPQSYFKISLFLPFLDHFLSELNSRFLKHQDVLKSFECLLPTSTSNAEVTRTQEESFKKLLNFYHEDIQIGDIAAIGELHMWYERVKDFKISSRKAINFYTACHQDVFPTINALLKILTTLPVSTSTSERSFSYLRRLKTYLRNTTGQQRLNGLAMLNTHRELDINAAEVLDELAKTPRRLEFRLS
ncbi:uncharacterized protein LOC123683377 [Harmonia axyridis]|uniref:uncharacterized protein LOC123683377 n=1 Tax=Harmonia axyridis TaxID=115357 RepID=UPI001E275638|nr:uncharacterized protein LOC123683377 [Harmonia axyridis]